MTPQNNVRKNRTTKVYKTLPAFSEPLYEERELEQSHTAFYYEYQIFEQIRLGNVKKVRLGYENYVNSGFVMGNMSANNSRQFKYWAVSGISIATHYAILGGADETDCFNLSDQCIRFVDSENDEEKIFIFLGEKLEELTYMVYQARISQTNSPVVRHALHYIYLNLHRRLTLGEIAKDAKVSPAYFSALFKKEMGIGLSQYITQKKLEAAKVRLEQSIPVNQVAYEFGFCSESHFIDRYKKYYGTTPGRSV